MGNRKFLKVIIWAIIVIIVIGYSWYESKEFTEGPKISITSPLNGSVVNHSLVNISGTAKNVAHLKLNGNKIFTDDKENFNEELLLSSGYNIIEISSQDKFGRKEIKRLELIYN